MCLCHGGAAPANINMIHWPFGKYRFDVSLVPPHLFRVFLCTNAVFLCSIAKLSILFHVRLYVVVGIRSSDRVMGVDVPSHSLSVSRSLALKNLVFVRESRLTIHQTHSRIWPVYTYKFTLLSLSLSPRACVCIECATSSLCVLFLHSVRSSFAFEQLLLVSRCSACALVLTMIYDNKNFIVVLALHVSHTRAMHCNSQTAYFLAVNLLYMFQMRNPLPCH